MSLSLPHVPPRRERRMARAFSVDRRAVRAAGALSASVIAFPLVGAHAEAATIPYPKPSTTLPGALDVVIPYQKGYRCLTETQPGVLAFAKLLNATYGKHTYGTLRQCAAEHGEGRALDWMLNADDPAQLALGNALTRWLSAKDSEGRPGAMARRFGINYIIWNRQQWYAWDPGMAWKPYYGSSPHTDHIHISFTWDGAYARTSWWTGKALASYITGPLDETPPEPPVTTTGYPYLVQGASGPDVVLLQKVVGAEPDGQFGPLTAAALGTWQTQHGLPATKAADEATWKKMVDLGLVPDRSGSSSPAPTPSSLEKYVQVVLKRGSTGTAVRVLQQAIGGLTVDGEFGPRTETRVKEYQTSKRLKATGVVDPQVWYGLMGRDPAKAPVSGTVTESAVRRYSSVVLRLWSSGEAVRAAQRALGGLRVDGAYGPLTQRRVAQFQSANNLAVTGTVDGKTWKALAEAQPSTPSTNSPKQTPPSTSTSTSTSPKQTPPSTSTTAPRAVTSSGTRTSTTTSTVPGAVTASGGTEFTAVMSTTLRRGSTGTAVRVLQRGLGGLAVDGSFGPLTAARVSTFQASVDLPATGVVDTATWHALELHVHPLLPYWGTVLRLGSEGEAVEALQKALGLAVDGVYGESTAARVKEVQASARIARTGVVANLTWRAVDAL